MSNAARALTDGMRNSLHLMLVLTAVCAFRLAAQTPLEAGYAALYNLDFDTAHTDFQSWSREHPNDALAPVSDAAVYLFAEFDRLHILQSEFFTHDQHFITDHKLSPDPLVKGRLWRRPKKSPAARRRIMTPCLPRCWRTACAPITRR